MGTRSNRTRGWLIAALLAGASLSAAQAADAPATAGTFKKLSGAVTVERAAQSLPAAVGMPLFQGDVVVTSGDGAAGITFQDDSILSLGPSARFSIDRFVFNSSTNDDAFESTLSKGKIAVVSGRIAKGKLDAMKVRTPSTILGVRGTEFLVEAQ